MPLSLADIEIPVKDEFDNPVGAFRNYHVVPLAHRDQLRLQKHIDVACFAQVEYERARIMVELDAFDMTGLDVFTLDDLDSYPYTAYDEEWSAGTVGELPAYNNWTGLTYSASTGTANVEATNIDVDITEYKDRYVAGLTGTDQDVCGLLTVACPDLASQITTASTSIVLTTREDKAFTGAGVFTFTFSNSLVAPVVGDSELRFRLYSMLGDADCGDSITGVCFVVTASGACTFTCLAVRIVDKDWVYAPIDFNTALGRMVRPVSRNGDPAAPSAFPSQSEYPELPTDFPQVFRADEPSSSRDPRPVDSVVTAGFFTGAASEPSTIALYFREFPLDENTQLDLDGLTMIEMDNFDALPDYGINRFTNRVQADLDLEVQETLDGDTQFDLERLTDHTAEAWIEVKLSWGAGPASLTILSANDAGYVFEGLTFTADQRYLMLCEVEDTSVRVRIYEVELDNTVGALAYDTTRLNDEDIFPRRRGRVGWYAQLGDGNSYMEYIRTRGMNHAEMITSQYYSFTPVEGTQLVAAATPDRELLTEFHPLAAPTTIAAVPNKTKSGRAYKVKTLAGGSLQGIETNAFEIDDFRETDISFEINFPSYGVTDLASPIEVYLIGDDQSYLPLNVGVFLYDRWQPITIQLDNALTDSSSSYKLLILQSYAPQDTEWFIDNLTVRQRAITWDARGHRPDPWGMAGDQWMPFRTTVNTQQGGVVFEERGKGLQIRARARRSNAQIEQIKVVPKYAQLGRLRWADSSALPSTGPVTDFNVTPVGTGGEFSYTFSFDAAPTVEGDFPIIARYWSFGDSTPDYNAETVTHTYTVSGAYTVSCTTIDSNMEQHTKYVTLTVPQEVA